MEIVYSINGVPIRLTEERWRHITSNKPYMEGREQQVLESVEKPTWILRGYAGSVVAVVALGKTGFFTPSIESLVGMTASSSRLSSREATTED